MAILRHPSDFDPVSERNLDAKGRPSNLYPENDATCFYLVALSCQQPAGRQSQSESSAGNDCG